MRRSVLVLATGLVVASCGGGAVEPGSSTSSLAPPSTSVTTTEAQPSSTTTTTTTTTTAATTTTTTTTPSGGVTVASVVETVEAEYQEEWDYYGPDKPRGVVGPVAIECDRGGSTGFGDVLACVAEPLEDREYWPQPFPIVILVIDDDGTPAHLPAAGFEAEAAALGSGKLCRDLVVTKTVFSSYGGAVAYWFLEGRPARMDIDNNQTPCETVFPLSDVARFWSATSRADAASIFFGYVTAVTAVGAAHEMTIDYAVMLSGMQANLAAEAAGEIGPGEGVPNDYYIVNQNPRLRTFAIASGVEPVLTSCGDEGCGVRSVSEADWAALVAEAARCEAAGWPAECAALGGTDWSWYGSGYLPYWIQLDGDTVIRVEEQYLP